MINPNIEPIDNLIAAGEELLKSHVSPGKYLGLPTLDMQSFTEWRAKSLNYLNSIFKSDHPYPKSFRKDVQSGYQVQVQQGMAILTAARKAILDGSTVILKPTPTISLDKINLIFLRFHHICRQLAHRYNNRETLLIKDEYDVQDLLHSLLILYFDDIRIEEWSPSYAGRSSRMDFLLKNEQIVIEVKKTRTGLTAKELGEQLTLDIAKYRAHPDCKQLLCFVYDPEALINNPKGIEADLEQVGPNFNVRIFIKP